MGRTGATAAGEAELDRRAMFDEARKIAYRLLSIIEVLEHDLGLGNGG